MIDKIGNTFGAREYMPMDADKQEIEWSEQRCMETLMNGVAKEIGLDQPFAVIIHEEIMKRPEMLMIEVRMSCEVRAVRQMETVVVTAEELYLKPEKKLIEKLKNAWRYLKGKDMIETREKE